MQENFNKISQGTNLNYDEKLWMKRNNLNETWYMGFLKKNLLGAWKNCVEIKTVFRTNLLLMFWLILNFPFFLKIDR